MACSDKLSDQLQPEEPSTHQQLVGGFDCEFVKQPREIQSECPVCLLILCEPHQVTCCGKSYCKECIGPLKDAKKPCPTCNEKEFTNFPNKGLQQSLYSFKVYCTHRKKGCEWTGELGDLDKHLNVFPKQEKVLEGCQFQEIDCEFQHIGCKVKLIRKEMSTHYSTSALYHLDLLRNQNRVLKEQLKDSQSECANQKDKNKQLEQEITSLKKALASNTGISSLSNTTLGSVVTTANSPVPPLNMKLPNYSWYKQNNEAWYSRPFYTHPHGYKMCLRVDVNGLGERKGTHVSVSVLLKRGEYDDQLKWPFRGDIVIQLLNLLEDGAGGHCARLLPFTDKTPEKFASRVTEGNTSRYPYGVHPFIALGELEPKYLKNDCLCFCVPRVDLN